MGSSGGVDTAAAGLSKGDFPEGFVFGAATASFQVEGGRREGKRGDSIWDIFCEKKGNIKDGSNGDVAVDQYHRYKDDVDLIANLGFGAYRFSISWPRIFPDGLGKEINEDGIAYYNNLVNALLEKGIEPFATLYHWDLPNNLQESFGGWLNEEIVEYFAKYAETCFEHLGDRVKHWITINEPLQTAVNGYGAGIFAPGIKDNPSTDIFLVAHHQLLAHAAAVAVYRKKFKGNQGGEIGMVVDCEWAEPYSDKLEDRVAAQRRLDFQLGWYLDPIYYGDYPTSMRQLLGEKLPKFRDQDVVLLRHSVDFIGLNHYTTRLISHAEFPDEKEYIYAVQKLQRIVERPEGQVIGEKAASEWLYMVPWGLRQLLNYISKQYHNSPIFVTENGMDEENDESISLDKALDDEMRVRYYQGYLAAVAQSIRDGTDVRGYFAWSLLDNFEWGQGYTKRFGIVYVDYKNGLSRHPKSSAKWFSQFLKGSGQSDGMTGERA